MNIDLESFCKEASGLLQFLGWALTIIKIGIPMVIIFYGVLDFGKAVVASKEDEIKTSAKRLMWRAIAGVCIFFVPSIVLWLFGAIAGYNDAKGGFDKCEDCILEPWQCTSSE